MLWFRLRDRRLAGFKFRRQMVLGPYILDFACIEAGLVVEADGGQHAEQQEKDARRSAWLSGKGYRILRFWNHEILTETEVVLASILHALRDSPIPGAPFTPHLSQGERE